MKQSIEHKGTVIRVSERCVAVAVEAEGACAACHARGVCGASEGESKVIDVLTPLANHYTVGETVSVSVASSLGIRAVLIAYVFPFVFVLALLIMLLQQGAGELAAGLGALGALGGYYLMLYLLRNRIAREFTFQIEKQRT